MILGRCIQSAAAIYSCKTEIAQAPGNPRRCLKNNRVKKIKELSGCGLTADVKQ